MCLAVPGQIQTIEEGELRHGIVSFGGITKYICLALVPEAGIGDYVIVHVGFAISKVEEQAAQRTFAMLDELDHSEELKKT